MKERKPELIHPFRPILLLGCFAVVGVLLAWRAIDIQVMDNDFLKSQGNARYLRTQEIPAHRGMISDRYGEPLAISSPVDSVWVNPQEFAVNDARLSALASLLKINKKILRARVSQYSNKQFLYLKRRVNPDLAKNVLAMNIPGLYLKREYKRFYPDGEVAAHVLGFTDIDDNGQEGLELAYQDWLNGQPGKKMVLKDRLGRVIENIERISEAVPGRYLQTSIDRRIQYIAYRELKAATQLHNARSGSVVVLDSETGEVVAMVNQPSYNPNNRSTYQGSHFRNRAITDVFEPGSAIKPFTMAAALDYGVVNSNTVISTGPGYFRVGRNTVKDIRNYGDIDIATIIQKSSNVGISKIALSLTSEQLWEVFSKVGFGGLTGSSFPGEVSGYLSDHWQWKKIERATMAYGYGLSVTALQLAHAYTILADDGYSKPISFLKGSGQVNKESVISSATTQQILAMMEKVVSKKGTGNLAGVKGYRVAGKTGTVQKSGTGGYYSDRYVSLFAGMAPASNPRLVVVVMINEPGNNEYYGGTVAAPVFSTVMAGALRMYGIAPDDVSEKYLVSAEGKDAGMLKVASGGMH